MPRKRSRRGKPDREPKATPRVEKRVARASGESGTRSWRRGWRLWGGVAVFALIVVTIGVLRFRSRDRRATSLPPLPPPSNLAIDSAGVGDFVGAETCRGCHQGEYAAWSRSTHAAAGGTPSTGSVIAAFNGPAIRFADATVTAAAAGGRYSFIVRQPGRADATFVVDAVVGRGHMQGGGTQGFLSKFADGTYRFLPFDFSRHGKFWFCNTAGRANRGWVPIDTSLSVAGCADWPPVRVLGDVPRFSNCQSCHGSQITASIDTTRRGYLTRFSTLAINCESCHGPGGRHVALVADSGARARGDVGMAALATLAKDQSLGVCWSCHALKDQLRPGYTSGKTLASYYSVRLPQLGEEAHAPDGRVRTFAYQEGHLYSDCYVNGGLTCTNCHDPHSQGYRDVTGLPLPGRFDDRQCTSCHASKADSASNHTHHAAASEGSRCVACHMPYLQEPELGNAVPYRRSDHTIAIPRPAFDSALGITSACKGCHAQRSEGELDAQVRAWYGTLKPHARAIDAAFAARRTERVDQAARLLLVPDERHTAALFDGLAYFLDHFLSPDMPGLDREAVRRLEALAGHVDNDIRAVALAALHFARGSDPDVHAFLERALGSLGDREAAVRGRWSLTLGYLGDKLRGQGSGPAAIATYRKAGEVDPGNPRVFLNLGLTYADAGDAPAAVQQFEKSLSLDPAQPLTLVNLGIARANQNELEEAVKAYRRALSVDAWEPLAYFNLGGLFLQQQLLDSAAANLAKAAALDESIAPAHAYLARILAQRGEYRRALAEAEAALQFDPQNAETVALRDELRRRLVP